MLCSARIPGRLMAGNLPDDSFKANLIHENSCNSCLPGFPSFGVHSRSTSRLFPQLPSPSFSVPLFLESCSRRGSPMLKAGIVGLPNVGKSTLFNAVTRTRKAAAENYPFCTIDPNVGVVAVPDARLTPLAKIAKTDKIIPAAIEFVDIAGLVKGASEGEGLGK